MAAKKTEFFSTENLLRMALVGLMGTLLYIFFAVKGDVDDLKKDSKEMLKQANETRLELVKAINAVEKQAIATNAKLDQLVIDSQRRR